MTVRSRAEHTAARSTAAHTDRHKADHISNEQLGNRRNQTAQARAREACDSSFPPKDHGSPPRAKEETGCAHAGAVDTTGIGGITGRIQQKD
jgi:hypothetical protein